MEFNGVFSEVQAPGEHLVQLEQCLIISIYIIRLHRQIKYKKKGFHYECDTAKIQNKNKNNVMTDLYGVPLTHICHGFFGIIM